MLLMTALLMRREVMLLMRIVWIRSIVRRGVWSIDFAVVVMKLIPPVIVIAVVVVVVVIGPPIVMVAIAVAVVS